MYFGAGHEKFCSNIEGQIAVKPTIDRYVSSYNLDSKNPELSAVIAMCDRNIFCDGGERLAEATLIFRTKNDRAKPRSIF